LHQAVEIDATQGANGNNRAYNRNGNLTQNESGDLYEFDYANRLVKVNTKDSSNQPIEVVFTYDCSGRKIQKQVTQTNTNTVIVDEHYYYSGGEIIAEYNSSDVLLRSFVLGERLDIPVSVTEGGSDYYFVYDTHGSVIAITNSSGIVVEKFKYDAHGNFEVLLDSQLINNRYFYVARDWETEIKLYQNRARFYDPVNGFFIQRDPLGYVDGSNPYIYTSGNSVNYADPLGLSDKLTDEVQKIAELKANAYWDIQNSVNQAAKDLEKKKWTPELNSEGSVKNTGQFGKDLEKLSNEKLNDLNQGAWSRTFRSAKPEYVTDAFVNLKTGEIARQTGTKGLNDDYVQADVFVMKPGKTLETGSKLNMDDVLLVSEIKSSENAEKRMTEKQYNRYRQITGGKDPVDIRPDIEYNFKDRKFIAAKNLDEVFEGTTSGGSSRKLRFVKGLGIVAIGVSSFFIMDELSASDGPYNKILTAVKSKDYRGANMALGQAYIDLGAKGNIGSPYILAEEAGLIQYGSDIYEAKKQFFVPKNQ